MKNSSSYSLVNEKTSINKKSSYRNRKSKKTLPIKHQKAEDIFEMISNEAQDTKTRLGNFVYTRRPPAHSIWKDIVTDKNGDTYFGQWNTTTNSKEGVGIMVYKNRSWYEGYWRNNLPNGKGRWINYKGGYYDGDWKDNKKHGNGVYKIIKNNWILV